MIGFFLFAAAEALLLIGSLVFMDLWERAWEAKTAGASEMWWWLLTVATIAGSIVLPILYGLYLATGGAK